jgi:hypothetical protein
MYRAELTDFNLQLTVWVKANRQGCLAGGIAVIEKSNDLFRHGDLLEKISAIVLTASTRQIFGVLSPFPAHARKKTRQISDYIRVRRERGVLKSPTKQKNDL